MCQNPGEGFTHTHCGEHYCALVMCCTPNGNGGKSALLVAGAKENGFQGKGFCGPTSCFRMS